jgi:ferric-dicitrate binding protein FerR (iron transport regulator)
MDEQHIKALVEKYLQGTCTEAERRAVEAWYDSLDDFDREAGPIAEEAALEQELWSRIATNRPVAAKRVRLHPWKAAAAVLLLVLGGTVAYFYTGRHVPPQPALAALPPVQVIDGQQAVLALGDGRKVQLDELADGAAIQEGNTVIRKVNPHQLEYRVTGKNGKIAYHTLSVPRGEQYELLLPDGSRVWLNAASAIRFRSSFQGKARDMELTGEAYFEVVQLPQQPFIVQAAGQTVQVLGTHFNIKAYKEEEHPVTTLLEGSVKISSRQDPGGILQPGEQAEMNSRGEIKIAATDPQQAIAWKNGDFDFYNKSLQDVMLDISRWYNITVEYQGNVPTVRFSGSISREKRLAEVLRLISLTQPVKFRQDSGRVLVMPR